MIGFNSEMIGRQWKDVTERHVCTGGHRVLMPLTQIAVSMRDHLLYRDPGWRLLENGVAIATASRERCCLVCGVTLLMKGIWMRGLPEDGDEGEWRGFKVRICVPRQRQADAAAPPSATWPSSFAVCPRKLCLFVTVSGEIVTALM